MKFTLLIFFFMALWTAVASLRLLCDMIRHPLRFFKRTKRTVPPDCMRDPALGEHKYVTANGLKFHYVSLGDPSKPLMLLLHGFPEFWFSWRHQLKAFSDNYHVVAVDLRGYNETERPPRTCDYALPHLRQDVAELIPALGHSKAVLVGHDWGGAIAWAVAQRHPDLVTKLVVMNCPHTRVFQRTITSTWAQLMKSWYMFLFQLPWLPEFMLSRRDYGYFTAVFRGKKAGVRNLEAFPPEAVEAYKYVFSQPGASTGPINYIRCIFSSANSAPAERQIARRKIETPTLLLWGDDDMFLERSMADGHGDFVTNLTVKHIPKCSHWVQQDVPDLVNEYVREFLAIEDFCVVE